MEAALVPIFVRNLKCLRNPTIMSHKNQLYALKFHLDYGNYVISRAFKAINFLLSEQKFTRDKTKIIKKDGSVVKLKTEEIPKISLIHESKEVTITLEEAKKIAKHKALNLIKIDSLQNKSFREVYKLVSDAEFLKVDNKKPSKNNEKKNKEKIFKFTSKISDNDIKIKVKNIVKVFKSCDSVRCCIKFVDDQVSDTVFEKIMEELGSSYTAQKISSPVNIMQFIIYKSEKQNEK